MTKKDLFRLIIKIFGLYSVITTLFSSLPSNISWVAMEIDLVGIIWITLTALVVFSLFLFLIYKPDTIIGLLRLDKGFDEERIDFQNINTDKILNLAVIIVGGIVLIENIPGFLSQTLFAFKESFQSELNDRTLIFSPSKDYIYWGTSFLNIIIGYLLLTNYAYVSRILKQKSERA